MNPPHKGSSKQGRERALQRKKMFTKEFQKAAAHRNADYMWLQGGSLSRDPALRGAVHPIALSCANGKESAWSPLWVELPSAALHPLQEPDLNHLSLIWGGGAEGEEGMETWAASGPT